MKTVCELGKCVGCMACVNICPQKAITIQDDMKCINATIDETRCVNCGLCYKTCQILNKPTFNRPQKWYQGWTNEEEIRKCAASGGVATSIAKHFVKNGGVVACCVYQKGKFVYTLIDTIEAITKISGSKYVKSNPQAVHVPIKKLLDSKTKVLFIGLPCHVGGLKSYLDITNTPTTEFFTVDLICHGTPSPQILSLFLNQYQKNVDDIHDIEFRKKNKYRLYIDGESLITKTVCDRYTIAFLGGILHTDNCCSCMYAQVNRVSDLTLGDSWGSDLIEERKNGISLILANTHKGLCLLNESDIHLENVDQQKAIQKNAQLSNPPGFSKKRDKFFTDLKKGENFNRLVTKIMPKLSIKSDLKTLLIKMKLYKV